MMVVTMCGCGGKSGPLVALPANIVQAVGVIVGTVLGNSGGQLVPLVGARAATSKGQVSLTDGNGNFRIGNVPAGQVTVSITATGFNAFDVNVSVDRNQTVNLGTITLTPAAPGSGGAPPLPGGDGPPPPPFS